jgi:[ribosomal protein S5]-alanine N-acetyltransferase
MTHERIETDRLILTALRLEDTNAMHALISNEDVMRYIFPAKKSIEETTALMAIFLDRWRRFGYGNWGIRLRNNPDAIIGWCAFAPKESSLLVLDSVDGIIFGFAFHPDYWGSGYATECAKACLEVGFEKLGFSQVFSSIHPSNLASQRVLEKIGMQFMADVTYNESEPVKLYSICSPREIDVSKRT